MAVNKQFKFKGFNDTGNCLNDMSNEIQKISVNINYNNCSVLEKSDVTLDDNNILTHSIGQNYPNAKVLNLQKSCDYNVVNQSFSHHTIEESVTLNTITHKQSIINSNINSHDSCIYVNNGNYGCCNNSCHVNGRQCGPRPSDLCYSFY